ncbi:FTRV1 [Auxenochlorella protothecoides x Auxenochlorella symbiontica]
MLGQASCGVHAHLQPFLVSTAFRSNARAPKLRRTLCRGLVSAPRAELGEGATVKVTAPITVFHSPKYKDGLLVQDYTGTIVADVSQFQGKTLSANKPWKVSLDAKDPEGKPLKLIIHLDSGELEEVKEA